MKLMMTLPLLGLALPVLAQIEWVKPSDPLANTAVRIAANRVLCRARSTFGTYTGQVEGSACVFGDSSARVSSTDYEIAIGPGRWDDSGDPGAVIAGSSFGNPLQVCRFRHAGQDWAGWKTETSTVCAGAAGTEYVSVTAYQILYPLDSSRLLISPRLTTIPYNLDQCLAETSDAVFSNQCSKAIVPYWQLVPSDRGYFKLRTRRFRIFSSTEVCVQVGGGSVASLTPCATADRFQLIWADGNSFSFQGPAGVLKLTRTTIFPGVTIGVFRLSQAPMTGASDERFAIRPAESVARDFKVVSYNMMLLPKVILLPVPIPVPPFVVPTPIPIFPELKQNFRAAEIAKKIHDFTGPVDVIAVQEAFDGSSRGDLIDAFKDRGYPFASKVPEFGGIEPVDGGVFIVSRWPIVSMESSPYSGTGTGFDFFSAKGYSYALINKLGKNYHVFCTHLQSDNVPKALEQLTELRTFVNSRVGTNPANDAVVIAGDMNIDMESEPSDYRSMLSRLNAIFPNPPRPVGSSSSSVRFRWTADSTTNDIKSARDSALSQSWLDYILFSQPGQLPSRASWEVKEYETSPKFKMAVKAYNASKTEHHDLSDHSAVIGTFRMPYSGPPVSSGETIEVAFDIASKNARDVPDLAITLDGVTLGPKERRDLIAGIGYRISVPEIAASSRPGCRHRFLDWTNGGAPEHVFTAAKEVTKMVATYVEECEVTGIVDPPGSGAIDGLGWKEVGKRATMIATPAAGFEFVEITGIKAEGNVASDRITEPTIVTAKFRAVELPALNAVSVGPRGDGGAGVRNVPLAIRNNGPGGATNVRITEVVNLMTTGGSGVASFASPLPVSFGAVPAGGASAPTMVQFTWPATVTRLQFTVRFTADGYSGSTTLNLVR